MGQLTSTQRGGGGVEVGSGGDDLPWWFKYLGRAFGILGGILAVVFGVLNCITISPKDLGAGLLLIVAGLVALVLEAPCCFVFLDFGDKLARWSESRKPWHKIVLYVVISIPPVCIAHGIFILLGCSALFMTGVAYGLMNLGKKATREEMAEKAKEFDKDLDALKDKLVFNERKPATSDSAPNGFTGDVNIETPTSVLSTNPVTPSEPPAPSGGMGYSPPSAKGGLGYSPLQNEQVMPSSAPVVMSPVDFESPGPSPARNPATLDPTPKEFKLAEPKASYTFSADVEQPFGSPQPQSTPQLPPPPQQQPRRSGPGGTPNLINL